MLGRRKREEDEGPGSPTPAPRTTPTEVKDAQGQVVHKRLGEILLDERVISREQLEQAVEVQKKDGGFIGQILVKLGHVTQEAVASCLVKQCKIPHLSLLDYDIGPEVLSLVPEAVCREHSLLPIDKLGRILTVAMVDPLDLDALEKVRAACPDLRIKPILCNWEHFNLVAGKVFKTGGETKSDKGGMTMQSLGLSTAPAAPKPAKPKVEEGGGVPAGDAHGSGIRPPMQVRAEAPASAGADLVSALRQSVQEAVSGAVSELKSASAGPSAEDLTSALRTAVREAMAASGGTARLDAGPAPQEIAAMMRDAMREAMSGLVSEVQSKAAPDAPAAAPSSTQLAEMISQGVGGAIQEALAAVLVQTRAHAPKADAPSIEDIAAVIRDSVGGAMQEAMATMVVQMRAMAKPVGDNTPDAIADALRASVREALEANQAALQSNNARLAEIAEAALQSVQQASLLVESASKGGGSSRPRTEVGATVSAFVPTKPPAKNAPVSNPEQLQQADERVIASMESERPQQGLTFDSFLPGAVNAFTVRLSEAVAANPGAEYNPFFLFGNVGVGKTHLINAMGNLILERNPGLRVGYISAGQFSRGVTDALRLGAMDRFREEYCHWDALILDDIQFLGGKVEAQEEFFHIFNVLHGAGRQIIIASDKAPDRLGLLEKRLVSRFGSGIVAELKAPEWETRMEILRRQVAEAGASVPDAILSVVAMRVPNDVRKMVGSLRKIIAYARLVGQDLSCEMANEILSHLRADEAA